MQSVCCLSCPAGERPTLNTFDTSVVISGAGVTCQGERERENCTDHEENMVNYTLGIASLSSEN